MLVSDSSFFLANGMHIQTTICLFIRCWWAFGLLPLNWVKLIASVVQVYYLFANFLSIWFINYREKSIGISSYHYNLSIGSLVSFSLLFFQILLYVFWSSVIRSINVQGCYVLLINWSLYHQKMILFISGSWSRRQHFGYLSLLFQLRLKTGGSPIHWGRPNHSAAWPTVMGYAMHHL